MGEQQKAILRTLAYADIFDYPLTASEIHHFLIAKKPVTYPSFEQALQKLVKAGKCQLTKGYYCLPKRKVIVALRQKRSKNAVFKVKRAKKIAGILGLIPWVRFIGITGALAKRNVEESDDIDLFFITDEDRLWLSRGLVVTFLRLFGLYWRPGKTKDMICPNMFLDKRHLRVPPKEQDLFSAHEFCQLEPILDKKGTYQQFLKKNQWTKEFLPNWKP